MLHWTAFIGWMGLWVWGYIHISLIKSMDKVSGMFRVVLIYLCRTIPFLGRAHLKSLCNISSQNALYCSSVEVNKNFASEFILFKFPKETQLFLSFLYQGVMSAIGSLWCWFLGTKNCSPALSQSHRCRQGCVCVFVSFLLNQRSAP